MSGKPDGLYTGQEMLALRQYYLALGFTNAQLVGALNNSKSRRENTNAMRDLMKESKRSLIILFSDIPDTPHSDILDVGNKVY